MTEFDSLFDRAMAIADNAIQETMATTVTITSGRLAGMTVSGVFDDPDSITLAGGGIRLEGSLPSLFVSASVAHQLRRLDTLTLGGEAYWVDRIGPSDCGSCHIGLGKGPPPTSNRRQ